MASIWWKFRRVIEVLTWTGNSSSRASASMPRVRSKLPSQPRKASWVFGVGTIKADPEGADSRILDSPKGLSRVAKGVAEGVSAIWRSWLRAWPMRSKRSARLSGSPPVMTRIGLRGKGRYLIDERHGHFGCELILGRFFLGRGAAMLADEITGLGDLVVEHEWIASEIGRRCRGSVAWDVNLWPDVCLMGRSTRSQCFAKGSHAEVAVAF